LLERPKPINMSQTWRSNSLNADLWESMFYTTYTTVRTAIMTPILVVFIYMLYWGWQGPGHWHKLPCSTSKDHLRRNCYVQPATAWLLRNTKLNAACMKWYYHQGSILNAVW